MLADTSRKTASELDCYKELARQQEEMIKKLQKGMETLLDQKEQKSLKRPNERFYKEYFFFLTLSAKRNEALLSDTINVHELYDKAQREHVPFHIWYQWIPQQIRFSRNAVPTISLSTSLDLKQKEGSSTMEENPEHTSKKTTSRVNSKNGLDKLRTITT